MTEAGARAPSAPAPLAECVFGDRLELAIRYANWLAGAGVERGLLGPRETDRLWERHLLNCAAVAALIPPGSQVVDIGSGAGLPGIALAIARPDLRITLAEPMLRRATFLEAVIADLGLSAVEVRRARAQELAKPRLRADVVTARAVAPIDRLAAISAPLLRSKGQLLAVKGAGLAAEVAAGWAGLRQAAMGDRVAAYALVVAAAGHSGPTSWLPGVEPVCTSRWDPDGALTSTGSSTLAPTLKGAEPLLAVVLQAHRNE